MVWENDLDRPSWWTNKLTDWLNCLSFAIVKSPVCAESVVSNSVTTEVSHFGDHRELPRCLGTWRLTLREVGGCRVIGRWWLSDRCARHDVTWPRRRLIDPIVAYRNSRVVRLAAAHPPRQLVVLDKYVIHWTTATSHPGSLLRWIRLAFDGHSTAHQRSLRSRCRNTGCWPASRGQADLFYLFKPRFYDCIFNLFSEHMMKEIQQVAKGVTIVYRIVLISVINQSINQSV